MTPERRQEIRDLASLPESSFRPLFPSATVLELLADNDALTAENATLKGEVERLKMIALCGDESHLLVIGERDTLRASLTELREAAERVRDIWQNEGMYEGFDESVHSLATAVAKAKEGIK